MKIERIQVGPRMSQAVIHGSTVYLAGQVAFGARGASVTMQMKDTLTTIDSLLAAAGSSKSHILSATIWLTDMNTFAEMNEIWDAWVEPGAVPARVAVGVPALGSADFKLEISIIAAQMTGGPA
jgi:enamine deaminase RidA (YjgF/YER057c/UK114 family)